MSMFLTMPESGGVGAFFVQCVVRVVHLGRHRVLCDQCVCMSNAPDYQRRRARAVPGAMDLKMGCLFSGRVDDSKSSASCAKDEHIEIPC